MNKDRLEEMFELREDFMKAMKSKNRGYQVEWPIDIGEKKSQQLLRDLTLKGVEELFESLSELKNWKSHKLTENPEVDRGSFLEEIIDSFNYFFAVLVLVGVTPEEFFEAYVRKDGIIHERINNGY
jgi:hypothetical protein